jgi:epsilon-lactone hydrolase
VEPPSNVIPFQAPDGVEIRHLRAFVAVAEDLNFSRAAERLYISQPALSRQIRTLEQLMGCDLLRRNTHRVELTLAGEALLDRARRLIADLDEAVLATQSVGGELTARIMRLWGPVVDATPAGTSIEQMREAYERFAEQLPLAPEVTVRPATAGGVPALALGDDPAILYLHGGSHILGSAYGYRSLVGAIVDACGTGALVPDFRLAPEHPFPAALEDSLAAYRWLVERRGDSSRVVVAGDSTGAGLALAVLLSVKASGEPMPAGAVLLAPGIDLSGGMLAPASAAHPLDEIALAAKAYLAGHPLEDPLVSPLRGDLHGLPPLLVQAATDDRARPQADALVDLARSHGVEVRFELYPSDAHVFHMFWSFLPEAMAALASIGAFTGEVLGGELTRVPEQRGD